MHRFVFTLLYGISGFIPLLSGCSSEQHREEILVFAAASLRESMEDIGQQFEEATGTKVLFNFAGSNDLAHQIIAAPRADIFLSANTSWMDSAEKAGRIHNHMRTDILANSLVVIANRQSTASMNAPCELSDLSFSHLALGNPDAVPAGKYARAWLASVICDGQPLWASLEERIVPAPDVRAALGLVLADPNVLGIVYNTDQIAFSNETSVLFTVTGGPPIRYVAARIADAPAPAAADSFYRYIAGPEAAEIFERHGFISLSNQP